MNRKTMFLAMATASCLLSGQAAAQTQPVFANVPANHWSYQAVERLAADKLISAEDAARLKNGEITRYDMAILTGKAMEHADTADVAQQALIEKLEFEYRKELDNMGVKLSAIEQKVDAVDKKIDAVNKKVDRIQIHGYMGIRYDWWKNSPISYDGGNVVKKTTQLDLQTSYRINDNLKIVACNTFNRSFLAENQDFTNLDPQQYVEGSYPGVFFRLGRFKDTPAYGMTYSEPMQGVELSFGKKLKTTIMYGNYAPSTSIESSTDTNMNNTLHSVDLYPELCNQKLFSLELDYPLSKAVNAKLHYQSKPTTSGPVLSDGTKFYEFGVDSMLTKKLKLITAMVHSNASSQQNGWGAMLQYGQAFPPIRGNYALYGGYYNVPRNSTIVCGGMHQTLIGDYFSPIGEGWKGLVFGAQFVPMNDTMITMYYMHGKTASYALAKQLDSGSDKNLFRFQWDFFF